MDRKRTAQLELLEAGFGSDDGSAADGHDGLLQLARRHSEDEDAFTWGHFLAGVPRKFLPRIGEAVARHAAVALGDGESSLEAINGLSRGVEASAEARATQRTLAALVAVVDVCRAFVESPKQLPAPDALVQTVEALHSVLLVLHGSEAEKLQSGIAAVCELWWLQGRPGREAVVTQLLPLVLVRSLDAEARAADVKRVWLLREALLILDFDDESIESLTELLLRCFLHPLYLRSRGEGRRFLAFLFGLHPRLVHDIQLTIKNQLPCTKGLVEAFGEVVFRAWRAASGPFLTAIEEGCVQEWMDLAIKSAVPATFSCLRQLLACFVAEKRQAGVDAMLMRLYEPLLWRALDAPNPLVRRNAATLFIDAFPLQDSDAPRAELDAAMQRQFDALCALVEDEAPAVRVVGVQGVCRVLGVFWELIPAATTRQLLTQLVSRLAYDTRSTAVRAAVFQGMGYVLDCALSHSVLRKVLPALGQCLHDRSERVRRAFVDMLLRVSRIRDIRFVDIVPLDDLLARLVLDADSPRIAAGLTQLLMPSFMPQGKRGSEQLARAIDFLSASPAAALVFYRNAARFSTPNQVAKLIILLQRALQHAIASTDAPARDPLADVGAKRGRAGNTSRAAGGKGKGKGKGKSKGKSKGRRQKGGENGPMEEADGADRDGVTLHNRPLMAAIIRAVTILWESIRDELADDSGHGQELAARVHAAFSVEFLEELSEALRPVAAAARSGGRGGGMGAHEVEVEGDGGADGEGVGVGKGGNDGVGGDAANAAGTVQAAMTGLLGVAPPAHAASLRRSLWGKLLAATPAAADELPALLTCLCRWGMGQRVLETVQQSLNVGFMVASRDDDGDYLHTVVAVLCVEYLAVHDPCGAWSEVVARSAPAAAAAAAAATAAATATTAMATPTATATATATPTATVQVTVQSLNEALTAATSCLEIALGELFDETVLDVNVVAREVQCDLAAPLAMRAACQLGMLVEGRRMETAASSRGSGGGIGGDHAPHAPRCLTQLLRWSTSVALPLLRRAMQLTSGEVATKCGAEGTGQRGKRGKQGKRGTRGKPNQGAAWAQRRRAIERRVRAAYDACAAIMSAAADAVALGAGDAELVEQARLLFGLAQRAPASGAAAALESATGGGGEAGAAASAGVGAGAGAGAAAQGAAAAPGLVDVVVAVPPPTLSCSALSGRGGARSPAGATKKKRSSKLSAALQAVVDMPAASRSAMTTPLLLHASRWVVQLGKHGQLSPSSVTAVAAAVLQAPARRLLAAPSPAATLDEEERRLLVNASALRAKPFVAAATWLHNRAGSMEDAVTGLLDSVAPGAMTYASPGGQWSPPEEGELPVLAERLMHMLVGPATSRTAAQRVLVSRLSAATSELEAEATFAMLAMALSATPVKARASWLAMMPELERLESRADVGAQVGGLRTWLTAHA